MNKQTEALKMAIEAMKNHKDGWWLFKDEIQACKEALEQPAQKPVAWWHDRGDYVDLNVSGHGIPLYTHPAPSWQRLSDNKIISLYAFYGSDTEEAMLDFARAIEQALKEKNHG